ncbi:Erg28 like protein-domain-containing protein [Lipomyces starkeyi]
MYEYMKYLPQATGLLPKWLLFISVVSAFNSAQSYFGGLKLTRRVYEGNPAQVTGLSARTFGTWTFLTALVRLYGAYHINNPATVNILLQCCLKTVYDITYATYIVAFMHFSSEWIIYKTAKLGKGLAGPLIVSSMFHWELICIYRANCMTNDLKATTLVWMTLQKSYYLNQ